MSAAVASIAEAVCAVTAEAVAAKVEVLSVFVDDFTDLPTGRTADLVEVATAEQAALLAAHIDPDYRISFLGIPSRAVYFVCTWKGRSITIWSDTTDAPAACSQAAAQEVCRVARGIDAVGAFHVIAPTDVDPIRVQVVDVDVAMAVADALGGNDLHVWPGEDYDLHVFPVTVHGVDVEIVAVESEPGDQEMAALGVLVT